MSREEYSFLYTVLDEQMREPTDPLPMKEMFMRSADAAIHEDMKKIRVSEFITTADRVIVFAAGEDGAAFRHTHDEYEETNGWLIEVRVWADDPPPIRPVVPPGERFVPTARVLAAISWFLITLTTILGIQMILEGGLFKMGLGLVFLGLSYWGFRLWKMLDRELFDHLR
jgi:hypothetical protein